MQFSKFESSLYFKLAKIMESESTLKTSEYETGIRAGYFVVGSDDDPINFVFSFPLRNDDCYFTLTDGDASEVSKEIASIQEYNENNAHLCDGHTVPTKNSYFNNAGWISHLITISAIAYDDLPNTMNIDGKTIRLHLVIPLSEVEYDVKLNNGYDELLDFFEKNERDIVGFNCA
jgi:Suppressor of fused protein (SUFU)